MMEKKPEKEWDNVHRSPSMALRVNPVKPFFWGSSATWKLATTMVMVISCILSDSMFRINRRRIQPATMVIWSQFDLIAHMLKTKNHMKPFLRAQCWRSHSKHWARNGWSKHFNFGLNPWTKGFDQPKFGIFQHHIFEWLEAITRHGAGGASYKILSFEMWTMWNLHGGNIIRFRSNYNKTMWYIVPYHIPVWCIEIHSIPIHQISIMNILKYFGSTNGIEYVPYYIIMPLVSHVISHE